MADTPTSRAARTWASAIANIDALHQQLDCAGANRPAIEKQIAACEEYLLGTPAPDLAAVIQKLELLWAVQLHGARSEACPKLTILSDLRHLQVA